MVRRIIITSIAALILISCGEKQYSKPKKFPVKDEEVLEEVCLTNTYDDCISHIKRYESFSSKRYLDSDGSVAIGYGHHIKSNESFPEEISESFANKLLEDDFEKYVTIACKYSENYNKQLAIAMFCFNIGESKYKKSTLKILVDLNLPIDDEIIKWCHFRQNGKIKISTGLLKRRVFELSVYNLNG